MTTEIESIHRKDSGLSLIIEERLRQVSVEGWTSTHDDEHRKGELLDAGICYAFAAINPGHPAMQTPPSQWPFDKTWWKPSEDPIRNLVKAGALFTAEIDRRRRMEAADD